MTSSQSPLAKQKRANPRAPHQKIPTVMCRPNKIFYIPNAFSNVARRQSSIVSCPPLPTTWQCVITSMFNVVFASVFMYALMANPMLMTAMMKVRSSMHDGLDAVDTVSVSVCKWRCRYSPADPKTIESLYNFAPSSGHGEGRKGSKGLGALCDNNCSLLSFQLQFQLLAIRIGLSDVRICPLIIGSCDAQLQCFDLQRFLSYGLRCHGC